MGKRLANAHLLIIGDSITLGATEVQGDQIISRTNRTYVVILREMAPALRLTLNAGMHRTTADALQIVDALIAEHNPDAVLLMVGGNDADLNWRRFVITDGQVCRNIIPLQQYSQNLRQAVATLKAAGVLPILTDLPNHDLTVRGPYISQLCGRDITATLERSGGHAESDRRLAAYRRAADEIATQAGCPIVRYGEALSRLPLAQVLGPDGVHPNARAHGIIAQTLYPVLLNHLARSKAATDWELQNDQDRLGVA